MANWYYVDQGNNRTGPVTAEALAEAYRQGQVGTDSLVWREGMAEWAPLASHLDELGLDRAHPAIAPAAPGTAPGAAPAKNKNGCLIAAIVLVFGGLFLVFVLAIVAAIALPAYQDYVARSKIAVALLEAQPAKVAVAEFVAGADRCPRDAEELGLAPAGGGVVGSIEVGALEDGTCAIELVLDSNLSPPKLADAVILLTLEDDGRWYCSSEDLRETDLPNACR